MRLAYVCTVKEDWIRASFAACLAAISTSAGRLFAVLAITRETKKKKKRNNMSLGCVDIDWGLARVRPSCKISEPVATTMTCRVCVRVSSRYFGDLTWDGAEIQ